MPRITQWKRFAGQTVTELPNQTLIAGNQIDHYTTTGPDGLPRFTPVKASQDELRQRDIDGYRQCLASVEERLRYVGEPLGWHEPAPSEAQIAERRQCLENEKAFILERLEQLGEPVAKPAKKK